MPITPKILDELLQDYEKPEDLLSENGLLQQLTKVLVERALNGELTHHLGYIPNSDFLVTKPVKLSIFQIKRNSNT